MLELKQFSEFELITLYSDILKELKNRGVIQTNNLVGEIGEYLAIDFYNKTKGLPTLQKAPPSTKNIDAISRDGERYSIKATTAKTTGVFYGIHPRGSNEPQKQIFEYVTVVVLNSEFEINLLLEMDWNTFMKHKSWHSRMTAWNLSVTKKLINASRILYSKKTGADQILQEIT